MNGSRTIFSERPAVAAARGDLIEQRQKAYDEPIDVETPNYLNPMSPCLLAFLCADFPRHRLRWNRRRVILTRRAQSFRRIREREWH
jgi:hypothetical protein